MIPVSHAIEKMIDFSNRNLHDINHFIKVWGYAKTIGELENLDENTQFILEIAAVIHDIPVRYAERNTEILMANYRKKKVHH